MAVAAGLAARCRGVTVAPAVAYGASGEHAGFPGTLLVGHEVLADLLVELVRSARRSFAGVVLVNAHGGNEEALAAVAARAARPRATRCSSGAPTTPGGDAHAGRTETSLMLAIDPAAVRLELAEPGCTEPIATLLPRLRAEGVRPVSSNGVLGDPDGCERRGGPGAPRRPGARPGRGRVGALVAAREPGRRRHRGGARHRRRDGGPARGRRAGTSWRWTAAPTIPPSTTPWPRRPTSRRWPARHGDAVRTVVGDVRSPSDMRAAVDEAVEHFGGLQAAVAAAGVISGGPPLWETADAQWDVQFDVNVNGVRHLAAAAVPALLEAPAPRQGRVVAVSSAAGLLGLRVWAPTARPSTPSSGYVRSLAADLAGSGITANAVCPGSTRGPMLDASAAVYGLASAEEFAGQQLVERLLDPAEPAALIAWLCGPASAGLTGAALPVDGGMTAS